MWTRRQTFLGAMAAGLTAGMPVLTQAQSSTLNSRLTGAVSPVHDPSIVQDQAGGFHLFTTSQMGEGPGLIHWRTSPDMVTWTLKGAVMQAFPDWVMKAVPKTRGAWAPDISYVNNQYYLYYAASTFGSNKSVIGLMTTPTLDTADPAFGWKDQGLVVSSTTWDSYNAIDPNHVVGSDGRHWLTFGSFWNGIKLVELDPQTGKPKDPKATPKGIAARDNPGAVEAPFIVQRGDYYYLFASYDFCCRGADSSYYTVVGRSKTIDGPYVDNLGGKMSNGDAVIVLNAAMDPEKRFKGPGGCSILMVKDRYFIVYHAYDAQNKGVPTLRIQPLAWTDDGWPVAV